MTLLIIYDTAAGSTGEIAEFMKETLSEEGYSIELKHVTDPIDLTGYEGVIIGGTIRYDHWLRRLKKYVKSNESILKSIPVAYFFSCLVLSRKGESNIKQANGYGDKIRELAPSIAPIDIKGFAGVLDYSCLGLFPKLLGRILFLFLRVKEGDYRDWDEIKNWTIDIAQKLVVT